MAGAKLSPRQRMINMMYLVLTALLALNVSKEVLNSFFEVNMGIVKTTGSLADKNIDTYSLFDNATNQKKVKRYKELASTVKPVSNELNDFIQSMKYSLVMNTDGGVYLGDDIFDADGKPIEEKILTKEFSKLSSEEKRLKISYLNRKDDRQSSTDLFNPENKESTGQATELKNKILDYRKLLLGVVNEAKSKDMVKSSAADAVIKEINKTLEIQEAYGDQGLTWEKYNFYDMPAVGALTLLSKWQADIKSMESEVISLLANNIDKSSLKFSGAGAITIPASNFILKGNEFKSQIFLTAFDENATPEVYVGDYDVLSDGTYKLKNSKDPLPLESGKGIYTIKDNRVGPKTYKGYIKILQDEGYKYYPFEGEYLVADKSWAISPTQMNVFYANKIENPIKVSVAGYQPQDIKVSFKYGSVKTVNRKKGEYIIIPDQKYVGKDVNVSLSVTKQNGKTESIGNSLFRVKPLPTQLVSAKFGDGVFPKSKILNNQFYSKIPDFFFDMKFNVSKFTVECIGTKKKIIEVNGSILSRKAKEEVGKLEKGQTVIFRDFVIRQKGVPTYSETSKQKFVLELK